MHERPASFTPVTMRRTFPGMTVSSSARVGEQCASHCGCNIISRPWLTSPLPVAICSMPHGTELELGCGIEQIATGKGDVSHGRLMILRSEEHTSELQSPCNLVCRLLL